MALKRNRITTTTTTTMTTKDTKKTTDKLTENAEIEQQKDMFEPKVTFPLLIWWYIGFDSIWVLIGSIASMGIGAVPIAVFLLLGDLINGLVPSASSFGPSTPIISQAVAIIQKTEFRTNVNQKSIWLAVVAGCSLIVNLVSALFLNYARDRISNKLKSQYFSALIRQEIGYFDIKRTGVLLSTMNESIDRVADAFSVKLGKIAESGTQTIMGLVFAFVESWQLTLVMIGVGPLLGVILGITGVFVKLFQTRTSKLTGSASNIANEVIGSIRTVRSMDGEEKEEKKYNRTLRLANIFYLLQASAIGIALGIANSGLWGAIALGFFVGGIFITNGDLTVGGLFSVYSYIVFTILGLTFGLQVAPDITKALSSSTELLKVIRRVPRIMFSGGTCPNAIEGAVEFKNVSFAYPSRPDVTVLKDFSMSVKPGQKVALVGASGSGKSTIVSLLERFYEATSGQILLDGRDVTSLDSRWIHRNIGYVTQEPTLFATTIKENIMYVVKGTRDVSEEEIVSAAKAANAHDFIMALPNGYDTLLGERGVSLSGGQKQRIAIARAIIQSPSLLLLDEATSALDTQSEGLVQEALNNLMRGRTSICIAHRLSTVIDSDVIFVLHKGELKEVGTHQGLLEIADGFYSKLAKKQLLGMATATETADTISEDI